MLPVRSRESDAFYGWWIVGAASLLGGLTGPGQSIGVSVFRGPMSETLGISDTSLASAYLVGTLLGSAALPLIGRRIDSIGARISTLVIGFGFAVALAHMSLVGNVAWLAIGFIGIRMLGQGALSMTGVVAVTHWFDRSRGFALGVTMMATSVLMALVPFLSTQIIGAVGWRWAWVVLGGGILLTVLPLGWFVMVDRPEDLGQRPDGGFRRHRQSIVASLPAAMTRSQAIRTIGFVTLGAAIATTSMLATGLLFHQVNILGESGFDESTAAALFVPQALGAIVGGLGSGALADTRVRSLLPGLMMALLAVSLFLASTATTLLMAVVYSIVLGLASGAGFSTAGALLPVMFGTAHIGSIQGALKFVGVVASSVGAVVFSVGADVVGSYQEAARWFVAFPVVMAVIAWWVRPGR